MGMEMEMGMEMMGDGRELASIQHPDPRTQNPVPSSEFPVYDHNFVSFCSISSAEAMGSQVGRAVPCAPGRRADDARCSGVCGRGRRPDR